MLPAHRMVSAAMASALTDVVRKMLLEGRLEHFVIDTMIAKILLEHVVLGSYKTLFCFFGLKEVFSPTLFNIKQTKQTNK